MFFVSGLAHKKTCILGGWLVGTKQFWKPSGFWCVTFIASVGWSMVVSGSRRKGGIGSIWGPPEGKDYKWYISGIFPANWGIICYLPPFRGTRNNHWDGFVESMNSFLQHWQLNIALGILAHRNWEWEHGTMRFGGSVDTLCSSSENMAGFLGSTIPS